MKRCADGCGCTAGLCMQASAVAPGRRRCLWTNALAHCFCHSKSFRDLLQVNDNVYMWPMVAFATAILLNLLSMAFERRPVKRQLCFLAAYISGVAFVYEFLAWKHAAPIYITAAGRPISLLRWVLPAPEANLRSGMHRAAQNGASWAASIEHIPVAANGALWLQHLPATLVHVPAADAPATCSPECASASCSRPLSLLRRCVAQVCDVGPRHAGHDLRPQHDIGL